MPIQWTSTLTPPPHTHHPPFPRATCSCCTALILRETMYSVVKPNSLSNRQLHINTSLVAPRYPIRTITQKQHNTKPVNKFHSNNLKNLHYPPHSFHPPSPNNTKFPQKPTLPPPSPFFPPSKIHHFTSQFSFSITKTTHSLPPPTTTPRPILI